jgi:hypothetical protein
MRELRIPLNDKGNVDVARMRQDTLEFARKLLADPSTRQAMGYTEEQLVQLLLSDEDVKQIYSMLGMVEVWFATRFRKVPQEIALRHLPFNEKEIGVLMQPTKVLAAKYIPASALTYKDEIQFGFLLVMFHRQKWAAMNTEVKAVRDGSVRTSESVQETPAPPEAPYPPLEVKWPEPSDFAVAGSDQ